VLKENRGILTIPSVNFQISKRDIKARYKVKSPELSDYLDLLLSQGITVTPETKDELVDNYKVSTQIVERRLNARGMKATRKTSALKLSRYLDSLLAQGITVTPETKDELMKEYEISLPTLDRLLVAKKMKATRKVSAPELSKYLDSLLTQGITVTPETREELARKYGVLIQVVYMRLKQRHMKATRKEGSGNWGKNRKKDDAMNSQLTIPSHAFNMLDSEGMREKLEYAQRVLNDPLSLAGKNAIKFRDKFINGRSLSWHRDVLQGLGRGRLKGEVVYYPYGGVDPYFPFTMVEGSTDVFVTGHEGFGLLRNFYEKLGNDSFLSDKLASYSAYDPTRAVLRLTVTDEGGSYIGLIALLRIIMFLNGDIEGVYYFDFNNKGDPVFLSEEDLDNPEKAKSAVIEYKDKETGEKKRFWYFRHIMQDHNEGFRRFLDKFIFQTLFIKAAPESLWPKDIPPERRKSIEETFVPAIRNNADVVADTTHLTDPINRRSFWRKDYAPEIVKTPAPYIFGYSEEDILFGEAIGLVTPETDLYSQRINLGEFIQEKLTRDGSLTQQINLNVTSELYVSVKSAEEIFELTRKFLHVLIPAAKEDIEQINISLGKINEINQMDVWITGYSSNGYVDDFEARMSSLKEDVKQLDGDLLIRVNEKRADVFIAFGSETLFEGEDSAMSDSPTLIQKITDEINSNRDTRRITEPFF